MCEQMDAFDRVAVVVDRKLTSVFFKKIERFTDRLANIEQIVSRSQLG